METALTSCLYDCEVVHKRLHPKKHEFRHRLFYFDVDLAELPELAKRLWFLGHNRFNLYSIRDKDHLDIGKDDLRENLAAWLGDQGTTLEESDRVRLVTMPCVLGYIFNPVCFYFIVSKQGEPRFVVVEVCNTFRELKPWLISERSENGSFRLRAPKHFYVSPFTSLDAEFDFRVRVPSEFLEIHIDDIQDKQTTLVSWIKGERKPLTNRRLAWYSVRFPFLSLAVILGIHWQAFLLWMKKVPYHSKRDDPELQTELYRPHSSLSESSKKKS